MNMLIILIRVYFLIAFSAIQAHQQYIRIIPRDVTVYEGEKATLKCGAGNLAGQVKWTKNGFISAITREGKLPLKDTELVEKKDLPGISIMSASVGGLLLFSLIIFLLRRILRRRAIRNREGNNQSNISDTVEMIVPNGCNEMEKKESLELVSSRNEDKKLWLENQLLQTRIVDVRIGNKLNGITETLPKYQGFDTLENNIKPKLIKILKNQDILLQKVAKLEVALSKMKNVIKNEKNHENMKVDNMFEPIDNIQDLNSLEDKLKDKDIFDEFLRKTNEICTLNRKISNTAKDDCCHVIDYFFTRNFMTQCSWTGACKERNMEKIPFKIYKNVIALFFEVIHLSNKTFTKQHCETFFKNVMKNSTRRNNNSATSRQTKSKNLKLCFLGTNNTVTESSNREMETVHHEEKEGQQNSVHD